MPDVSDLRFLEDVAAMQVDAAVEIANDGDIDGLWGVVQEIVAYASNIRERRDLVRNYYFALGLANALSMPDDVMRRDSLNLFIKSHGFFTVEVR